MARLKLPGRKQIQRKSKEKVRQKRFLPTKKQKMIKKDVDIMPLEISAAEYREIFGESDEDEDFYGFEEEALGVRSFRRLISPNKLKLQDDFVIPEKGSPINATKRRRHSLFACSTKHFDHVKEKVSGVSLSPPCNASSVSADFDQVTNPYARPYFSYRRPKCKRESKDQAENHLSESHVFTPPVKEPPPTADNAVKSPSTSCSNPYSKQYRTYATERRSKTSSIPVVRQLFTNSPSESISHCMVKKGIFSSTKKYAKQLIQRAKRDRGMKFTFRLEQLKRPKRDLKVKHDSDFVYDVNIWEKRAVRESLSPPLIKSAEVIKMPVWVNDVADKGVKRKLETQQLRGKGNTLNAKCEVKKLNKEVRETKRHKVRLKNTHAVIDLTQVDNTNNVRKTSKGKRRRRFKNAHLNVLSREIERYPIATFDDLVPAQEENIETLNAFHNKREKVSNNSSQNEDASLAVQTLLVEAGDEAERSSPKAKSKRTQVERVAAQISDDVSLSARRIATRCRRESESIKKEMGNTVGIEQKADEVAIEQDFTLLSGRRGRLRERRGKLYKDEENVCSLQGNRSRGSDFVVARKDNHSNTTESEELTGDDFDDVPLCIVRDKLKTDKVYPSSNIKNNFIEKVDFGGCKESSFSRITTRSSRDVGVTDEVADGKCPLSQANTRQRRRRRTCNTSDLANDDDVFTNTVEAELVTETQPKDLTFEENKDAVMCKTVKQNQEVDVKVGSDVVSIPGQERKRSIDLCKSWSLRHTPGRASQQHELMRKNAAKTSLSVDASSKQTNTESTSVETIINDFDGQKMGLGMSSDNNIQEDIDEALKQNSMPNDICVPFVDENEQLHMKEASDNESTMFQSDSRVLRSGRKCSSSVGKEKVTSKILVTKETEDGASKSSESSDSSLIPFCNEGSGSNTITLLCSEGIDDSNSSAAIENETDASGQNNHAIIAGIFYGKQPENEDAATRHMRPGRNDLRMSNQEIETNECEVLENSSKEGVESDNDSAGLGVARRLRSRRSRERSVSVDQYSGTVVLSELNAKRFTLACTDGHNLRSKDNEKKVQDENTESLKEGGKQSKHKEKCARAGKVDAGMGAEGITDKRQTNVTLEKRKGRTGMLNQGNILTDKSNDSLNKNKKQVAGENVVNGQVEIRKKFKRMVRCGQCTGCKREECLTCVFCRDKKKNGGKDVYKKSCIERKCLHPRPPQAKYAKRRSFVNTSNPQIKKKQLPMSLPRKKQIKDKPVKKEKIQYEMTEEKLDADITPEKKQSSKRKEKDILKETSNLKIDIALPGSPLIKSRLRSAIVEEWDRAKKPRALSRVAYSGLEPKIKLPWPDDKDEDAAWLSSYYYCLTNPLHTTGDSICFLCGSGGGTKMICCVICSETFHDFCLELDPLDEEKWCCDRCKFCRVCGYKQNLLMCDKCHDCYHAECLGPNYQSETVGADEIWVCGRCIKCTKCGKKTPGKRKDSKWMHAFTMCDDCNRQWRKGCFCPICSQVYDEDDFEAKMIMCSECDCWIHMGCEGINEDEYECLSDLPDEIPYICKLCHEGDEKPAWYLEVKEELQAGFQKVYYEIIASKDYQVIQKMLMEEEKEGEIVTEPTMDTIFRKIEQNYYAKVGDFGRECLKVLELYAELQEKKQGNAVNASVLKILFSRYMQQMFPWYKLQDIENKNQHSEEKQDSNILMACASPSSVATVLLDHAYSQPSNADCQRTLPSTTDIGQGMGPTPLSSEVVEENCSTKTAQKSDDELAIEQSKELALPEHSGLFHDPRFRGVVEPSKGNIFDELETGTSFDDWKNLPLFDNAAVEQGTKNSLELDNDEGMEYESNTVTSRQNKKGPCEEQNNLKICDVRDTEENNCSRNDPDTTEGNNSEDVEILNVPSVLENPEGNHLPDSMENDQVSIVPGTKEDDDNSNVLDIPSSPIEHPSPDHSLRIKNNIDKERRLSGIKSPLLPEREVDDRRCLFCNQHGDRDENWAGRLLLAGMNEWVHVNCALWSAEVYEDKHGRLQNVQAAVSRGNKLKCDYCQQYGATVGCCSSRCPLKYHFECSREAQMAFQDDKKAYCSQHSHKLKKHLIMSETDFAVERRVLVDMTRAKLQKKFQQGVEPKSVKVFTGSIIVHRLGRLDTASDTKQALIPVGYRISRLFWSTTDPRKRCRYTCSIEGRRKAKEVTKQASNSDQCLTGDTIIHSLSDKDPLYLENEQGTCADSSNINETKALLTSVTECSSSSSCFSKSQESSSIWSASSTCDTSGSSCTEEQSSLETLTGDSDKSVSGSAESSNSSFSSPTVSIPWNSTESLPNLNVDTLSSVQVHKAGSLSKGPDDIGIAKRRQCGFPQKGKPLNGVRKDLFTSSEVKIIRPKTFQSNSSHRINCKRKATDRNNKSTQGIYSKTSEEGSLFHKGAMMNTTTSIEGCSIAPRHSIINSSSNTSQPTTLHLNKMSGLSPHSSMTRNPTDESASGTEYRFSNKHGSKEQTKSTPSLTAYRKILPGPVTSKCHTDALHSGSVRSSSHLSNISLNPNKPYWPPSSASTKLVLPAFHGASPGQVTTPLIIGRQQVTCQVLPSATAILSDIRNQLLKYPSLLNKFGIKPSALSHILEVYGLRELAGCNNNISQLILIDLLIAELSKWKAEELQRLSSILTYIRIEECLAGNDTLVNYINTYINPLNSLSDMLNHSRQGSKGLFSCQVGSSSSTSTVVPGSSCSLAGMPLTTQLVSQSAVNLVPTNTQQSSSVMYVTPQPPLNLTSAADFSHVRSGAQVHPESPILSQVYNHLCVTSFANQTTTLPAVARLGTHDRMEQYVPVALFNRADESRNHQPVKRKRSSVEDDEFQIRKVVDQDDTTGIVPRKKSSKTKGANVSKRKRKETTQSSVVYDSMSVDLSNTSSMGTTSSQQLARPSLKSVQSITRETSTPRKHSRKETNRIERKRKSDQSSSLPKKKRRKGETCRFQRMLRTVLERERKGERVTYKIVIQNEEGWRVESNSLEDAWRQLVFQINEIRMDQKWPVLPCNGPEVYDFLGISREPVVYLAEQLPGGHRCKKYRFHYHLPCKEDDNVELPKNPHGCARAEVVKRSRKDYDMFAWLSSPYRTLPPQPEEAEDAVQASAQDLPMAMRYRQLKSTVKDYVGVYRSTIHGRGLYCKRPIEVGEMIIEYAGSVIRASLTDRREDYYEKKGYGCYMFRVDDVDVVDATLSGNAARFINHSCEPNCYSKIISVDGQKKIIIFAGRRIQVGEELTYDYKFPIEDEKITCTCGAKKCRKYLN